LALLEWLNAEGCRLAAMEATGVYWLPVWKMLRQGEFELVVANAAHIKAVPGRKTDMNDAMWIADLTAARPIRLGGQAREEQLLQGSVVPLRARLPAKGDLRRGGVDSDRHLSLLKNGTFHQDLGADYFDRRSPESKVKRLARQMASSDMRSCSNRRRKPHKIPETRAHEKSMTCR